MLTETKHVYISLDSIIKQSKGFKIGDVWMIETFLMGIKEVDEC